MWFITGAGRGMGVDFAKAAFAAGHHVVATGRTPDTVPDAIGEAGDTDNLLVVRAGRHRPGRGPGRRSGGGRAVRTHRCAGQQRRELLRR
jgi:NAD(P)-dependent dehydrogenase (short-subunit alcohol dehydrogenase family)